MFIPVQYQEINKSLRYGHRIIWDDPYAPLMELYGSDTLLMKLLESIFI